MQITSTAFHPNTSIPEHYTCRGENESPPLLISAIPEGTASLALVLHDPDAPAGDWAHWTLWNIPITISEIEAGVVPSGAIEGLTSKGSAGYHGPCPPPNTGTHRYIFELYALDTVLELPPATTRETLEMTMQPHVIAHAQLIGLATAE